MRSPVRRRQKHDPPRVRRDALDDRRRRRRRDRPDEEDGIDTAQHRVQRLGHGEISRDDLDARRQRRLLGPMSQRPHRQARIREQIHHHPPDPPGRPRHEHRHDHAAIRTTGIMPLPPGGAVPGRPPNRAGRKPRATHSGTARPPPRPRPPVRRQRRRGRADSEARRWVWSGWRWRWDLNPRKLSLHTLSRRAPSATRRLHRGRVYATGQRGRWAVKNLRRSSADSSARTPRTTSGRELRRRSRTTSQSEPTAPAFGSSAP